MKRLPMKRLIPTLACILAVLIWTGPPAQAEHGGTLLRDQDWILNVDAALTAHPTAFTIYYLGKGSGDIDLRSVPAATRTVLAFSKPGRGVKRIIIEMDTGRGDDFTIEMVQGNHTYTGNYETHGRIVFEVADAL